MKKVVSREGQVIRSLIVLFVSILVLAPFALADEPAPGAGGGGEGMFSRWMGNAIEPFKRLTNFTKDIDLFSELSPADVGVRPRVRPHVNFTQGFISNARLGEHQGDPAWQARVSPGISVAIPSGKLYTEADYTYGFSTTQGRRTHSAINSHNVSAMARYDLTADTVFGLGNNFQLSEVPATGSDNTFILETATIQVKHRIGPKLSASLWDTFQWFRDQTETVPSRQSDFLDYAAGTGFTYDVTADLNVGPTVQLNVRNFPHRSTKDYWQALPQLNASYRLGPKTTVNGNVGWAFRRFDQRPREESEVIYGASFSHVLSRRLSWSFSYAKSLQDTFATGFVYKDTAESSTLDNLDRDFRVIKSHRFGSSMTYHLNERSSVGAWGDVAILEGEEHDNAATLPLTASRKNIERIMEMGAKYNYRINRYLSLEILYSFGRRMSTDANNFNSTRNDYTFHKATGGVNLTI